MSATEDDTELRDLLIQNLENSGVLNKLKAEMRAAVFLAMEDQDRLENKTPLVNENLQKCLNTKDGRLVASLLQDFLQVFHLDFTLAVFQPEINSLNGLEGREAVCRELALSPSQLNRNCPLLLELVRRGRQTHGQGNTDSNKEPSQKQTAHARRKFESYDKDGSGGVVREDLKQVFAELFPSLNRTMLEAFVADELRAADRTFSRTVDVQTFLGLYKRLFTDCTTVVLQDCDEDLVLEKGAEPAAVNQVVEQVRSQRDAGVQQQCSSSSSCSSSSPGLQKDPPPAEGDPDDGDSFFDDPLPEPQKTYGGKVEVTRARGSPVGSAGQAGTGSSQSEQSHSRDGASESRGRSFRDTRKDRTGSLHLEDDVEYDDDFNSHRSDPSKSEVSIGEEIEEGSIEGPDISDKVDESTQDVSVSQLSQSHGADYLEDVA
ncbi:centrosomal protein 43 isoform X2 [Nelusetta ayraudi]|uniref:centrosomal protein 43 isoform X2 n=1 Tax=Nelusetta ayraudi TaxID=303726 RepID=UPI003F7063DF